MNDKYIIFLILAILVIAFLWNKNENIDSNIDNIIAKGTITTPGNITGGGLISEKDAWIKGLLTVNGNVNAGGNIIARGGNIIADKTELVTRRLNSAGNGQIQLAISPNIIAVQDTNGWSSQPLSIVSSTLDVNGVLNAKGGLCLGNPPICKYAW